MLAPSLYLDTVADAIDRIAVVADGRLDQKVEHCPGFDLAKLLEHTGGFCRIVAGRVARDEEWTPPSGTWQRAPADEVAGDPIGWHRRWGSELVSALRGAVLTEPVSTWAGRRTRYFWLRRAAHELTVHRWDAEHASDAETSIRDVVAIDGIDEFLGEFGDRAGQRFDGSGETFHFVVAPDGVSFTVTMHDRTITTNSHLAPDVVVRGTAAAILRFVWGRATPDELDVEGHADLVERWHRDIRM